MVESLTNNLLRTYRQRVVTPVIIKSKHNRFENVRAMVKDIVPVMKLQASPVGALPMLNKLIEFPFSKFKSLPTFDMVATVLTPRLIEEVAQWNEVETIYPDYIKWALEYLPREDLFFDYQNNPFTSTAWTKKIIGADRANRLGFTGKGTTAVVIDTGGRPSHPQLRRLKVLTAMPEKGGSGLDSNGHGTWCCSCVGGTYAVDRRYGAPVEGMSPECSLVSIQSLGFVIGTGTSSDIMAAMETCIGLNADVVSMSLGSNDAPPDAENPEAQAINKLVANNIIPVIAAGNSGPLPETIGSPGSCENALTIGAWNSIDNELADFSSRGPTSGDKFIKPDVVAPGFRIDSGLIGFLDTMTDPTQRQFGPISGTSMATPHVAGLVSLMRQCMREKLNKILTVDEIKKMMSELGEEKNINTGWGMITWDKFEKWLSTQYNIEFK